MTDDMDRDENQILQTANWENAGHEVAARARALLTEIGCDHGLQYEQWVAGALLAARENGREEVLEHEREKYARLVAAARAVSDSFPREHRPMRDDLEALAAAVAEIGGNDER